MVGWGRGLFSTQWSQKAFQGGAVRAVVTQCGGGSHAELWRENIFAVGAPLQGQRSLETAWHFQGAERRLLWLARGA